MTRVCVLRTRPTATNQISHVHVKVSIRCEKQHEVCVAFSIFRHPSEFIVFELIFFLQQTGSHFSSACSSAFASACFYSWLISNMQHSQSPTCFTQILKWLSVQIEKESETQILCECTTESQGVGWLVVLHRYATKFILLCQFVRMYIDILYFLFDGCPFNWINMHEIWEVVTVTTNVVRHIRPKNMHRQIDDWYIYNAA